MQNISLVPLEQRALALRQILEQEGAEAAETSLMTLAEAQGDQALAVLVEEMRPIDLNRLLREFDLSKSSVAVEVVSPEKAAEALKSEARFWIVDGRKPTDVQDDVVSLLASLILASEDPKRRAAMLDSIGATTWGQLMLEICFADRPEFRVFAETGSFTPGSATEDTKGAFPIGEWQELAFVCRKYSLQLFTEVAECLRSLDEKFSEENLDLSQEVYEEEEFPVAFPAITSLVKELVELSREEVGAVTDDLFKPL